jgi:hypothetical protein
MDDHDFGGFITDEDVRNLARAMMSARMPDMADAMTWFPLGDPIIRSHP